MGKDGTKWKMAQASCHVGWSSTENVFTHPPMQIIGCEVVANPVDTFQLFMSDELIRYLVVYTNAEGDRQKGNLKKKTLKKTDANEMKGLLGCILFGGVMKQNMLPAMIVWDIFYGQGLVHVTMSHNRFFELLVCMHFNDKNSRSS